MGATRQTDDEQTALWNGPAGRAWVDVQDVLDQGLKPMEDLLVEEMVASGSALECRVLDVGCGTGGTTLAVARRLGPKGRCVGIDLSEPMIIAARSRNEQKEERTSFIHADVQSYPFEPSSFDWIISRFGVMFFDDPVQAFANLWHAATGEAALRFIAWRSPAENAFMTTAERAAASLLPNLPVRRTNEPGQFAFANPDWVRTILAESGWTEIDVRPIDPSCTFPEKELIRYVTRLGPVGRVLDQVDERTRAQVIEKVRAAFDPYVQGAEVHFTAACWMVCARA